MNDSITVPEAADILGVELSRVRNLAAHGQIPARKVGRQWLLDRAAVEQRAISENPPGRSLEARNAWATIQIASGNRPEGIDPSVRSRLRRALKSQGLSGLRPRLGKRAKVRTFGAHPGEIPYLIEDPDFTPTGITASGMLGLDLVSGAEADGYVGAQNAESFLRRHALSPDKRGSLRLRIVPEGAWYLIESEPISPPAAVALDLAEDRDPRSILAGEKELAKIDERWLTK